MSLAREIFEKMVRTGQVKGEPEPLPLETPVQPSKPPGVDPVKGGQPEPGTPGPLFSGSIEEDLPESHGVTPQAPCLKGIPSDDEINRLKKPLPILSQYLDGEVVYLVRDEEMASEAEKQGKIAFNPGEIIAMTALCQSRGKDEWISCLKAVCQAKKVFEGSRVIKW